MEELELIVQRMMDAGESEENIKAVVQEFSAGKQTDPVNVEANTGSEKDMASKSENGSSDSQKDKPSNWKIAGEGFKGFANTAVEVIFDNTKDVEQWAMTQSASVIEMIKAKSFNLTPEQRKSAVDNAAWFQKTKDDIVNYNTATRLIADRLMPGGGGFLFNTSREAIDETQKTLVQTQTEFSNTITEEILSEDTDYGEVAARIFRDGLTSAPFTLMSMNPYTAGFMGVGLAGDKFVEEVNRAENKDGVEQALWRLNGAAATTGTIEMIDALITRRLLAAKGLLPGAKGVAAQAVKQMEKGLGKKVIDVLGIGLKEGGTEIGQSILNKFSDSLWLDRGVLSDEANPDGVMKTIYQTIDEGIIGAFSGGGVTAVATAAQSDTAIKDRVEYLLMPKAVREQKNKLTEQFIAQSEKAKKLTEAGNKKGAKAIEKSNKKILSQILELQNKNSMIVDNLQGKDLQDYAKNIDAINALNKNKDIQGVGSDISALENINNEIFDRVLKQNYGENVSFTEIASKQLGLDTVVAKSNAEFERLIKGLDGKNVNGAFIGNGKIIINQRVALKQGAVGVGSHEVLHPILNAMVGDAKSQKVLVNKFKKTLNSKQLNWVEGELKAQGKKIGTQEYFTEYFNVFSEGLVKNRINFDEGVFTKVKNYLTKLYQGKGFDNIDFESGRGAYNFMKAYDKSIKSGKISQDILNVVDKNKVAKADVLDKIQLSDTKEVQEVNDIYNNNTDKQIAGFDIADKYRGMAEAVFNSLKEGSNYTQNQKEVFDGKKEDMLAMMLYDKIPSQKEDSKARNVVGLVQDFESKKQKYNNVAAYINTFFKERSKEVFKYFSKDAVNEGLTKEDGTMKTAVSNKTNETSDVDQGKKARKLSSFDKLMKGDKSFVDPKIKSNIITKLTKNLKRIAFKGRFNAENITNEIKSLIKQEIENTVVKRMGKISKTKTGVTVSEEYKSFHSENFNSIIKALPVSVIKKKYLKLFNSKKIAREKTGPGNAIFEIKPTSKGEFGAYFTIGGYTTLRARQRSLANEISAEIIKDQATILKQDIDFVKELAEVADLSGVEITELVLQTELESLADQFDRKKTEATKFDRIQFSKNLNSEQQLDINKNSKAIGKLSKLGESLTPKVLRFELEQILDSNVFSKKDISEFSNAIMKVLKSIHSDKNTLDLKLDITKLINEKLSNDSVATNLTKALNLTSFDIFMNGVKTKFKNFGQIFTLKKYVDRQRRHYLNYAEANMNNVDDVVNQLKWFRGHMTTAGAKYFMIKRYQIFSGNKDFIAELNKILKPQGLEIITKTDAQGVKAVGLKQNNKLVLNQKQLNALLKKPAQKSNSKAKLKEELEVRKVAAKEAWDNLISYLSYVKENGDVLDFAMTMMSLKSNMASMLKAAAPVEYYFSGKYSGTLVYEHIIPTEYIVLKLTQHFYGKSIDLEALRKRYKVAIVPKTMDNNINVFRQEIMPVNWDVNQHETKRYFDSLTLGFKNMFALESLSEVDSSGKPVMYGESHAKAQFSKIDKVNAENFNKAMVNARNPNALEKGISVFDFDDTIAQSNSKVLYELPDGKKGSINATEFALQSADLEAAGAVFNFEEFSKVIEGKKGPLFDLAMKRQDKFTSKDIFILTARPQEAAFAIHAFLKGMGLTIPVDNITGLADGKPSAKADWIISKAAEGYNNFYFADDAYKNVKAVQKVLDIIDVKRDVQLAKIQFSKDMGKSFNDILEQTKNVASEKRFSKAAAESRGRDIGKWKFFLPPSAEDFVGLIYNFLGKGKVGEQQMDFFNKALVRPFARAMDELNRAKQAIATDFRALKKTYPEIKKLLAKVTPYNEFTYDTAVRVYIWTKNGKTIPGLSKTDIKRLNEIVENNSDLKDFADTLDAGVANNNYPDANGSWLVGNIATDLKDITDKIGRREFLQEWLANKEVIFSKENLNKIEAIYGSNFREALEDMLYRMENGTNRSFGKNRLVNSFSNWVNNSVGAIMFLNMRSAILQTISFVNFVNWSDNNPLKFAAAILNVKQFSKDFVTLFNSDMLKQRRAGIGRDVNESEIAEAMSGAKNKPRAILNYLLRIGFTPTQLADSFAISVGGAAFYRNRINTYLKEGMTQEQALEQAFTDFQETSEVSQQSSRPDMISQQQAGPLGRLILAFQNTPMQYTRLMKKAFKDLINGRGDAKTNMSKIVYYGVVQNIIFASMQSALFAMLFDDDGDEDKYGKKKARIANTMTDSILRGSGLAGAGISTVKNVILKFLEQEEKGWNADHAYTVIEAANFSPPIGSKLRKLYSGIQTYKFNKEIIADRGLSLNNPAWQSAGNFVSAATNIPLDRAINKYNNLRGASNNNNEAWQRIAMALGWSSWDVDAEVEKGFKDYKKKLKQKNKIKKLLDPVLRKKELQKKMRALLKKQRN